MGRPGTFERKDSEDEIPPESTTMNHTPTGWSAPSNEISTPGVSSEDRSRSGHDVPSGRPVACASAKAPANPRPPQTYIIHSDVEVVHDDRPVTVNDSDDEDMVFAANLAIHQKELEMLQARREHLARKASRSTRKSKSSQGGDVEDILTLLVETEPGHLNAGALLAHEVSASNQAIQEASSSSSGALAPPPGLMLLERASRPMIDVDLVVIQEVEDTSVQPLAVYQGPTVGTYGYPGIPIEFGPSSREVFNQKLVETANLAYEAGAKAVSIDAEQRHSQHMKTVSDAYLASEQRHANDALVARREAETLHEQRMTEASRAALDASMKETFLAKQEAERLLELRIASVNFEALEAVAFAQAKSDQLLIRASEYVRQMQNEGQMNSYVAHAAAVEEKATNSEAKDASDRMIASLTEQLRIANLRISPPRSETQGYDGWHSPANKSAAPSAAPSAPQSPEKITHFSDDFGSIEGARLFTAAFTQALKTKTTTATEAASSSGGAPPPPASPFKFPFSFGIGNPLGPSGSKPPPAERRKTGDPPAGSPGGDGGGDGPGDDDPEPEASDAGDVSPEDYQRHLMESFRLRSTNVGGKEAESVKLKPLPNAVGFRSWRNHVRTAVTSASKDPRKAFTWILAVEHESATWDSMKYVNGDFETLGTKLATAVTSIARGDLGTKISLVNEEGANRGEMVSGRQLLWLVYQSYKLSQTSGALYSLVDLTNLKIKSEKGQRDDTPHTDKQLRWFVSSWDGLIAGMKSVPDVEILEDIFLRKIRNVLSLKEDLAYYDRLSGDHVDKSFVFLKEACTRLLERKREHENRSAIEAHIASGGSSVQQVLPAAPATKGKGKGKGKRGSTPKGAAKREPSKGVCYDYKNTGKCDKPGCPYLHKREGSPSPGKGKGKGKKGNRSPSGPRDKNVVCKYFASTGTCKFGADCHYSHSAPPAAPAPAKKARSRSRGGKKKSDGSDPP